MSSQLEAEKREYESQLELVITSLKDDPDNTELLALKFELDEMLAMINDSIAELAPAAPPAPAPTTNKPAPAPPAKQEEKWSRENHPAFKKVSDAQQQQQQQPYEEEDTTKREEVTYQVNDSVMAKWVSGDKGFYPARITSITGSRTEPIYTVKFKSYDTVETLRGKDIRPVPTAHAQVQGTGGGGGAGQKRKADGGVVGSEAGKTGDGIVLSAGAELYPGAKEQREREEKQKAKLDENGKPKFKKIKANKELEAGKNKWQEFNAKGKVGKVKGVKKDSMFRTPEGVKGRVGFTGSGQGMRKDPMRSRHVYQPNEDLD